MADGRISFHAQLLWPGDQEEDQLAIRAGQGEHVLLDRAVVADCKAFSKAFSWFMVSGGQARRPVERWSTADGEGAIAIIGGRVAPAVIVAAGKPGQLAVQELQGDGVPGSSGWPLIVESVQAWASRRALMVMMAEALLVWPLASATTTVISYMPVLLYTAVVLGSGEAGWPVPLPKLQV